MKKILFFILTVLLFSCGRTNKEKSISVIECEDVTKLKPNLDLHKDKDVELFFSKFDNHRVYSCIIYRIDNGELKGYQIYDAYELNTYDEATYQWVNDSSLTFTLINEHHKSRTYKVTGYGGSTALAWD